MKRRMARLWFGLALGLCGLLAGGRAAALEVAIIHDNDPECHLVDGTNRDSAARFVTQHQALRAAAAAAGATVLVLNTGDLTEPGLEMNATLKSSPRVYYDLEFFKRIPYDAFAIGNHDFDQGPAFLAEFVNAWPADRAPLIACNIDWSGEAALNDLAGSRLVTRLIVDRDGEKFGLVGATTPWVASISSPGQVVVKPAGFGNPSPSAADYQALAAIIQPEIDALIAAGVTRIILMTHLQVVDLDGELIKYLHHVDVMVTGGWHGDLVATKGSYPWVRPDADGRNVYLVTASGHLQTIGCLRVTFDAAGEITAVDSTQSRLVAVDASITPDADTLANVCAPVNAYLDTLAATPLATTDVALMGLRDDGAGQGKRVNEANLGDLCADAYLWKAKQIYPAASVALLDGGGMRVDEVLGPGTLYETFPGSNFPYGNLLVVIEGITPEHLKVLLEHGVAAMPAAHATFPQTAGLKMVVDPSGTAQVLNADGTVQTPGTRVVKVVLNSGRVVVENGQAVAGESLTLATDSFIGNGGDNYPFRSLPTLDCAQKTDETLREYIKSDPAAGGLGGAIRGTQYPYPKADRVRLVSQAGNYDLVERLYVYCLERQPDDPGFWAWTDALNNGQQTAGQAARGILFSPEMVTRDLPGGRYALGLYRALLERDPETTELADWITALGCDRSRSQGVDLILASPEFHALCTRENLTP